MEIYGYTFTCESDLQHHGIKGQKWGVRRFQNEDGTWTAAGRERYGNSGETRSASGTARRALAKVYDINQKYYEKKGNTTLASMNKAAKERQLAKAAAADAKKAEKKAGGMSDETKARLKTAAKVGAVVAGTALATYGAYKLNGLAVESLKAGDRYLASQKTAMANMHLDNYVKQMGEYYNAKGPNPITNSTNPELYSKLQKMNASADAAARRYIDASKEASQLTARADSGKYTTKEKLDALKRMAKR